MEHNNLSKIALYPGTFDPITNGHFDIIQRALKLFDKVIVAVADSTNKKPMFSLEERIEFVKLATAELQNVEVIGFNNLTVECAKTHKASILIRGLRAVSDFEYEIQLGYLNNSLDDTIETVYLMPTLQHAFVSSSAVRSLISFKGKTEHLIPEQISKIIEDKKCI